jgi:hypothetical protein
VAREHRHADLDRHAPDRLRRPSGHPRLHADADGGEMAGGAGLEERRRGDVHEYSGPGRRRPLRPLGEEQGTDLRARHRHRDRQVADRRTGRGPGGDPSDRN